MTSPDKVRRIKDVLSDIEKVCGNCMYNGEPNGCNRIGGVCEMFDAVWDALDYIKELEMIWSVSRAATALRKRSHGAERSRSGAGNGKGGF